MGSAAGSALAQYLESHGIHFTEDAFVDVVRDSIERVLGSARGASQPGLPPEELRRFEGGGFSFRVGSSGPDHPVVRGAAEFAALLGSALTVAEAARLLGVNAARVRQRLGGPKRTLYGIKRDREWWLPRFQFAARGLVPGIAEVVAALDPGLHPVSVWRWFTTPSPDLRDEGGECSLSPLDWLSAGYDPDQVVGLAAHL